MKTPKAMNIYLDCYDQMKLFSDEQTGRLLKALLLYAREGEITDFSDDLALNVTFCAMSKQVQRDFDKYRETCEKRSKAARLGAQAKHSKEKILPFGSKSCQEEDKEKYKEEYEKENKYNEEEKEEEKNDAHSAASNGFIPLEFISDIDEIVAYLNHRTGFCYRATTFSLAKMIMRRLCAGRTVEDCKLVIDRGCDPLRESGVNKNLLPIFLFGSRFDSILAGGCG